MQKKSARMRHRYFVRTQYGVIKIKSLSYNYNSGIFPNCSYIYLNNFLIDINKLIPLV
ncbi:hypothetical protein [Arsenophonus endosymbiont of Bemisia tabaci]|uniref:hypothetical protein n=1 Tax=Arsenophonus endosymbiont of Bemisia tabaci TaxID=536059 RepID=UPI0015F53B39|nr:hypothetical protein [Arsenophonus endosymbiont of Bemisia tabaci]